MLYRDFPIEAFKDEKVAYHQSLPGAHAPDRYKGLPVIVIIGKSYPRPSTAREEHARENFDQCTCWSTTCVFNYTDPLDQLSGSQSQGLNSHGFASQSQGQSQGISLSQESASQGRYKVTNCCLWEAGSTTFLIPSTLGQLDVHRESVHIRYI